MWLGARWGYRDNFTFDVKSVAGTRGLGPGDLPAQAENTPRQGQTTSNEEPHRRSGGVPTASRQSSENAHLGRRFVEMEWLGVELGGELLDPRLFHDIVS
jgi:hypothetical protein